MNANNSKEKFLTKLFSLTTKGIKPGLERTLMLLEQIGNPHLKIKTLHVAGTNGKGSTCSIMAYVLQNEGYKTGLYTSPHLFQFNERIRINGQTISDDDLMQLGLPLLEYAIEIGATFFEITTALAFDYFAKENVDYAVVETGMGGMYDSTNVITPLVSTITSISMDHSEYLGDSIEKIAMEKAGIAKSNIPLILGNIIHDAQNVILQYANNIGAKVIDYQSDNDFANKLLLDKRSTFDENLALALQSLTFVDFKTETLQKYREICKDDLKIVGYRFRQEILSLLPCIIVDVAHNEESIASLVEYVQANYQEKFSIIFTCMIDKNYKSMIESLSLICNELLLTRTGNERDSNLNLLKTHSENLRINTQIIENPKIAWQKCINESKNFIVCGSFFLLHELENELLTFKGN